METYQPMIYDFNVSSQNAVRVETKELGPDNWVVDLYIGVANGDNVVFEDDPHQRYELSRKGEELQASLNPGCPSSNASYKVRGLGDTATKGIIIELNDVLSKQPCLLPLKEKLGAIVRTSQFKD